MIILSIFGTRPEAIKFVPVLEEFKRYPSKIQSVLCVTSQHRKMLDQVLDLFNINPTYDLNLMQPNQQLQDVFAQILVQVIRVINEVKPHLMLVQGDTITTFATAMAAYFENIKIGHIEAGLRTGKKRAPFPEEMNRRLTSPLIDFHFVPTYQAKQNLMRENIDENIIFVTGNTVIDTLEYISQKLESTPQLLLTLEKKFNFLTKDKHLILITAHRRENFGRKFENICLALKKIASKFPMYQLLFSVHLNPKVRKSVYNILGEVIDEANLVFNTKSQKVILIEPQDYLSFIYLLKRAFIVITDSGGIQEEAPHFGKPVLIMRDVTERPEAIRAGTAKLIGTEQHHIVEAITELLTNPDMYHSMAKAVNPYGDGLASQRIVNCLLNQTFSEFSI